MPASLLGTGVNFPNNITQSAPNLNLQNNLLVNGDMRVHRPIASGSGFGFFLYPAVETWNLAGWFATNSNLAIGSNQTDVPAGTEYIRSARVLIGATGLVAGNTSAYAIMYARVCDVDMYNLNWGTASAKSLTLGFWVKCSVTGTHSVGIVNGDPRNGGSTTGYSYNATYTISAANTWEFKTISIPGPTGGTTWFSGVPSTGTGFSVVFPALSSTVFTAPSANTWNAAKYMQAPGAVNYGTTANASFLLAGVSLEVGSSVTPYVLASQPLYSDKVAMVNRYSIVYGGAGPVQNLNSTATQTFAVWQSIVANYIAVYFNTLVGTPSGSNFSMTGSSLLLANGTVTGTLSSSSWSLTANSYGPSYMYSTSITVATGQGGYMTRTTGSNSYLQIYV